MIKKNGRIYYLDILRVIACLSVIIIHSCESFVTENIGSADYYAGNFFSCLASVAVPLFLMISGALMLDEGYEFSKKKLVSHIRKMIILFMFWSATYCVIFEVLRNIFIKHKAVSAIHIIGTLIKGPYHFWFIYLIIGLYLIIPLLRLWVKIENKKYIEYFLILSIIFTFIIPQIISVGTNYSSIFIPLNKIIENNLCIKYVGGYTSYYILGWYLVNYDFKHKKLIYALGILGFILSLSGTYIISANVGHLVQVSTNLTLNVLLQATALFFFVKDKFSDAKENKFISSVSKNSLGIYAIHLAIVNTIYKIPKILGINIATINIFLIFIVAFTISWVISVIFNKIPYLRKVV